MISAKSEVFEGTVASVGLLCVVMFGAGVGRASG